jgi:hypothetical protein
VFKVDGIELKSGNSGLMLVFVGVVLLGTAAGWFRSHTKAEEEGKSKLAVARDLKGVRETNQKLVQLNRTLQEKSPANLIASLPPDLQSLIENPGQDLSPRSLAVLDELEKTGR